MEGAHHQEDALKLLWLLTLYLIRFCIDGLIINTNDRSDLELVFDAKSPLQHVIDRRHFSSGGVQTIKITNTAWSDGNVLLDLDKETCPAWYVLHNWLTDS